jgi:hypothetical protein
VTGSWADPDAPSAADWTSGAFVPPTFVAVLVVTGLLKPAVAAAGLVPPDPPLVLPPEVAFVGGMKPGFKEAVVTSGMACSASPMNESAPGTGYVQTLLQVHPAWVGAAAGAGVQ